MHHQGRSSSSSDAHQAAPSSENDIHNLPFVHGTANFLGSQNGTFAGNSFGFGWVPHQHPIFPMSMPVLINPHVQTMIYPQGSIDTSSSTIHPFIQSGSSTQFVPLMPVIHHDNLRFTSDVYAQAQTFAQHRLNIRYQQQQERMRQLFFQFIQQTSEYERGLSEEVIAKNFKHEKFEIIGQLTSENKKICVICQEDIVNGEEVGKLDNCVHQFHICCITQWLTKNNVCPICKKSGLSV